MTWEALLFVPDASIVVTVFENGDRERKIHCNVELTDEEQNLLVELETAACGKGFFPSIAVAATRYLAHCRGDVSKSLAAMQLTQSWKHQYFSSGPITVE